MLLCLGLDYKHGGFVDRALEAFSEVLRLDPDNRYALSNLEKLYEEQHQWTDAYAMRQKLAARDTPDAAGAPPGDPRVPRERDRPRGAEAAATMPKRRGGSRRRSSSTRRNAPAYLNLGDVRAREGDAPAAIAAWERLVETVARARLPRFARLERAYAQIGDAGAISGAVPAA